MYRGAEREGEALMHSREFGERALSALWHFFRGRIRALLWWCGCRRFSFFGPREIGFVVIARD